MTDADALGRLAEPPVERALGVHGSALVAEHAVVFLPKLASGRTLGGYRRRYRRGTGRGNVEGATMSRAALRAFYAKCRATNLGADPRRCAAGSTGISGSVTNQKMTMYSAATLVAVLWRSVVILKSLALHPARLWRIHPLPTTEWRLLAQRYLPEKASHGFLGFE